MDAYELQQKILDSWRNLCKPASATRISKPINDVPVYVESDQGLKTVCAIRTENSKIILSVNDESK